MEAFSEKGNTRLIESKEECVVVEYLATVCGEANECSRR